MTHFQTTPLFSMTTESLTSSQSCHSIDADAWCKQAVNIYKIIILKTRISVAIKRTNVLAL